MANLWDYEEPISSYPACEDVEIPRWIEQDISPSDIAAIVQGGCDSGAYMPAVTYHTARVIMASHGDAIADYIEDATGEDFAALLAHAAGSVNSWDALACHFVSLAVETWAASVEDELSDALEGDSDDEPDEPTEGDYILTDSGPLGSRTAVSQHEGRHLGDFSTEDEALAFIREHMATENFRPDVWRIDDHGGLHGPIDIDAA